MQRIKKNNFSNVVLKSWTIMYKTIIVNESLEWNKIYQKFWLIKSKSVIMKFLNKRKNIFSKKDIFYSLFPNISVWKWVIMIAIEEWLNPIENIKKIKIREIFF